MSFPCLVNTNTVCTTKSKHSTRSWKLKAVRWKYFVSVCQSRLLIALYWPILTTNLAAVVCVCVCVCVRKIWPISALTLLFRIHTSRKLCSHSKIPIRCLWTAFCVPLSLIFYDKRWFRIQIVTVRRSRFAALWQIINSRNPFSRRGWMARGQRENVAECNDHGSNPVQGTIFCFHFYCLRLTKAYF